MKLQVRKDDAGIEVIELEGDLDFQCSPDVRRELAKLAERQAPKIVVNLKAVGYIDSSGLATFVELFQKMKRYGGKLALYELSEGVRGVFEIAKLDKVFKLAGSREDAFSCVS